ncbi:MAG: QueT transporter family protein [Oscillospiraceae bacterium]|jgi:uncharacterized membrane protein|nr:QueT transporter family protein [Oscillospiraceae bacterium]
MSAKKTNRGILFLAQAALIAALYAGLCYAGWGVSFGPWQFRFAEALTLLPVLTPAAIPGLTIGCALANLGSPFGLIDIIFGSLATLLAAVLAYLLRRVQLRKLPLLSALMPVVCNGVIVGAIIALTITDKLSFSDFSFVNFLTFGGQVALTEFVICYGLGLPLAALLRKVPFVQFNKENPHA